MSECKIEVFWQYEHVADLFVDYDKCTARVINYSKEWHKLPFLLSTRQPTWEEYKMLIDSRVFPRERKKCKETLTLYDLQYYDQEAICRKSHAVMFDDLLWFRYPDEEVIYDDVKVRDLQWRWYYATLENNISTYRECLPSVVQNNTTSPTRSSKNYRVC